MQANGYLFDTFDTLEKARKARIDAIKSPVGRHALKLTAKDYKLFRVVTIAQEVDIE